MRKLLLRQRVRTWMLLIAAFAIFLWSGMLGVRFLQAYLLATKGAREAQLWREIAARRPGTDPAMEAFQIRCAAWCDELAEIYGQAMWRPWVPLPTPPPAPWSEQMRLLHPDG